MLIRVEGLGFRVSILHAQRISYRYMSGTGSDGIKSAKKAYVNTFAIVCLRMVPHGEYNQTLPRNIACLRSIM